MKKNLKGREMVREEPQEKSIVGRRPTVRKKRIREAVLQKKL